ncbi:TetR family transcriptional regulator [Tenggerimyces flavus]|uniref:TetR family transcriptional regulator n=1 Tax=Tenggerimyces flavus TaxID=1708749 RepID=A0ABV7YJ03_9ACTN|nr:TetR family transcriptional regulator [Tenggerimyces flavus]MBM7789907.1 AcrR family transcriptional regulator [Tenggerimyces flavus]
MAAVGNAEATKEHIVAAAMAEFSAYGIAGARVDRIAQTAGCNKNLIYIYFGSKEKLFAAVLDRSLLQVYEAVDFTPDDLPGYAARVFEFALARPDVMRLMAWFALERTPEAGAVQSRGAAHSGKVAELAAAQRSGQLASTFDPNFLLTAIMSLATAWSAVSPFGPVLDQQSLADPVRLRQSITTAVALLAQTNEVPAQPS